MKIELDKQWYLINFLESIFNSRIPRENGTGVLSIKELITNAKAQLNFDKKDYKTGTLYFENH